MEQNLIESFRARTQATPNRAYLRYFSDGAWRDLSYGRALARVEEIAGGLAALGVRSGDRVAILAGARPEWALADLGTLAAGAVAIGIDPLLSAREIAYALDNAEARVAFVEDRRHADRLAPVRHRVPVLERVVVLEGEAPDAAGHLTLAELEALAPTEQGADRLERQSRRTLEAPAAICFTRGTTGASRAVVLTHGNIIGTLRAAVGALGAALDGVETVVCAGAPKHVLGRVFGHLAALHLGRTAGFARGRDTLAEDLAALGADALIAVPRQLERLRDRIGDGSVAATLGERLSLIVSCGDALAPGLGRYFEDAGIAVFESWGLAETAGPITLSRTGARRAGTVGRPLPGIEVRVAGDGELLVHGPGVCAGYHRDPEGSEDALDANGFLRTGDVGYIDDHGYVHLTGRRRDLIVTADGRAVAPQKLEQLLRERPFIASALAFGHERPFVVALLTVDREAIGSWHPELRDRPIGDPALHALLEAEVRRVNDRLPRPERIRAFRLLEDREIGADVSTPRRLRRRETEARYRKLLDAIYAAEQVASRA